MISSLLLLFCLADDPKKNVEPQISNVKWNLNRSGTLHLRYDLFDAENDSVGVEIIFLDSVDQQVHVAPERVRGDHGFPVKLGKGKRLSVALNGVAVSAIRIAVFDTKISILNVLSEVDERRIASSIEELSVPRHFKANSKNLKMVQDKLSSEFTENNFQVSPHPFPHGSYEGRNLIALKQGVTASEPIYIGAHVDAVPSSRGADDNASGIAALLEISRVLARYQLKKNVNLIAFDMEEEGLVGSKKFLEDTVGPISGYFNLDMIGYTIDKPNSQSVPGGIDELFPEAYDALKSNGFRADFLLVVSNERSRKWLTLFNKSASRYVPDLKVISLIVPDDGKFAPRLFRGSDHASFWDRNIDAVSLGDTGDVRNRNYHSDKDVPETVNMAFIYQVTKAVLATIVQNCELFHGNIFDVHIAD